VSGERHRLPHKGAAALFHEGSGLALLQASLLYHFKDINLLKTALTHPTANARSHNQRLEFLGDAVLQLVISRALFDRRRDSEGKLTFSRQKLVNEEALEHIARQINLGACLLLGKAFQAEGGAEQPSVLADAMEALIAAIYLDGGLDAAQDVVLRLWDTAISRADSALDSKGALQAWYQARGLSEPVYRDISAEGPPHKRKFTAAVYLDEELLAQGVGRTKRLAQQAAAQAALNILTAREAGQ